ncbi:hypothetical protein MUY27_00335 [Mucilaginibacter sp. RS28]|uniref:Molybdenum ABC transporter permease n=1 Tax=Mucilaginibacter straminoryzae TaxID=2932774 RepID=A0A9X1WYS2_9SPHI|nr:hypothetical protein [Mucilaginibacter straminoryzae]MCJ8208132.1 hypothetical protein [Mucilaginibacter straminoryzae]
MKILSITIGIILIALSIYGRYWRGKRKFNRANFFGEGFKSYNDFLKKTTYENFIHFLGVFAFIVGALLILIALLLG